MVTTIIKSPVFWSGLVTLLRTGGFFLVLPVVLRKVPTEQLGMWYVFLGIAQFSGIVELGFAPNISRFASFFMGGAKNPKSIGIAHATSEVSGPNLAGLKGLAEMAMSLYPKLGYAMGVIMTCGGGWWLFHKFGNSFWNWQIAPAFFLYTAGMTINMYGYFWMNLLFGVDRVREGQQIFAIGLMLNYFICVFGLMLGMGLYALALGQITLALFPRWIACFIVKKNFLDKSPSIQNVSWRDLWPMTWRSGLSAFGAYLSLPAMTLVCAQTCGLVETAEFGLSMQLALMLQALSATWMAVLWPKLGTMRTRREFSAIRRLVGIRLLLSLSTYLLGAGVAFFFAPLAIQVFRSNTHFLSSPYLALLLAVVGIDMMVGLVGAILLTGNRVPQLGASLFTGFLALVFAVFLSRQAGVLGVIIAPALAQLSFNLWSIAGLFLKDMNGLEILSQHDE